MKKVLLKYCNFVFLLLQGYVPAFVRLAPHTILTFLFLEQLRDNFGFIPTN